MGVDVDRLLYDRKEAARQLSISVRTLDRLIGTKRITARRIGRSVLIPHVELMKLSRRDVVNV
jgi:excisionase family DNA binding protein